MVREDKTEKMVAERYREAQRNYLKRYAMATLVTSDGQLRIEGLTPRVVVLDTGASAVILGRTFANRIRKCRPPYLSHGDSFITAGGREDMSLGRSKLALDFVLAKGTSEETLVNTTKLIADTDASDVILGMDFLGTSFGYLDPLTEEYMWRVDCHETEHMPKTLARLPAKCRGNNKQRMNNYMIQIVTCTNDLEDAILG